MLDGNSTVANVEGIRLTLKDLLRELLLKNTLRPALNSLIWRQLIAAEVEKQGVTISPDQLQQGVNRFRAERGLFSVDAAERWMKRNFLNLEDVEQVVEHELAIEQLRSRFSEGEVAEVFRKSARRYSSVRLARIVVDRIGLAEELLYQIEHEGASFAELALRQSIDRETAANGGSLGVIPCYALDEVIAEQVLSAEEGAVVGPITVGQEHHLIWIGEIHAAELDEALAERIRTDLFQDWANAQLSRARVSISLSRSAF